MSKLLIETRLFEGRWMKIHQVELLLKVFYKRWASNQNERVYPKEILMREAEVETLIKERRAWVS